MSSVEGKLDDDDDNDDDDDDICPSYSRSHTLCIQYFSSLVRSIHSRTVASFLNLHFITEELYNGSDGAQKPLYGDIYLAGFLKTLLPYRLLPSKVAIIKTKSATIAFFSSPPFVLPAFSFSPFLFLRWCDFGAYRA